LRLIQQNWNAKQEVPGEVQVRFTILRDGVITSVEVEQSSRYAGLDLAAQRALLLTRRLPDLPSAFGDDHLTVHLRFQYQR
jgi:TonB family protein